MKMQIRTLKSAEYEGCPIHIRNIGNIFEYLTIIDGQIYTAHVVIVKKPLQALLGQDYTPKQLADVCSYVFKMAETTIETVRELKKKPK